jgi:hypothetical protein
VSALDTEMVDRGVPLTSARVCSKCKQTPIGPTQRWCSPCKRAAERRNAPEPAGTTAGEPKEPVGETREPAAVVKKVPPRAETPPRNAAEPKAKGNTRANELVPFTPFLDGLPDRCEGWYPPFIIALAKYGRITLAAGAVQVHRRVAYAHIAKNRALSGEVEAAKAHYRSGLEYGLAHQFHTTGNVLAGFGALKAELPARYIEKQVVMNVDATSAPDGVDAVAMLRAMLGDLSPATRALIAGETPTVIDVPPALPEGDAAQ